MTSAVPAASPRGGGLHRGAGLLVPLAGAVGLAALGWWPQIRTNPEAMGSFLAAAATLLVGTAAVFGLRPAAPGSYPSAEPGLRFRAVRPHWVQALAQLGVLLYWGWYVQSVFDFAPYLLAQVLFAYGFEALVNLYRRRTCTVGFGPLPFVFSINLFLWFKPDWFYLQFGMIALGYLAKEFLRWERDGRSTHIFNPSAFPLAVASLALIVAGATDITFGLFIASSQGVPPHIYAAIFLVSLPGQLLFGVAPMTIAAVVTAGLLSQLHLALTGSLFFEGVYIPAAVFLGMHLLFTDPSTAPRTEAGRIVFGVCYGASVMATAALLLSAGAPGYFDKLLVVPLLNLSARGIDGWVRKTRLVDLGRARGVLPPYRQNLAAVGLWVVLFVGLTAAGVFRSGGIQEDASIRVRTSTTAQALQS